MFEVSGLWPCDFSRNEEVIQFLKSGLTVKQQMCIAPSWCHQFKAYQLISDSTMLVEIAA